MLTVSFRISVFFIINETAFFSQLIVYVNSKIVNLKI